MRREPQPSEEVSDVGSDEPRQSDPDAEKEGAHPTGRGQEM